MSKPLHQKFYKRQIENIQEEFENQKAIVLEALDDLKKWSVENQDFKLDQIALLKIQAQSILDETSKSLDEEIENSEEEDPQPDWAAEPLDPEEVYVN